MNQHDMNLTYEHELPSLKVKHLIIKWNLKNNEITLVSVTIGLVVSMAFNVQVLQKSPSFYPCVREFNYNKIFLQKKIIKNKIK